MGSSGLASAIVLLLLGGLATAGARGEGVDVDAIGPQVGEQLPAFALPDQDGTRRDFAALAGPRGAMVVFSRSADW